MQREANLRVGNIVFVLVGALLALALLSGCERARTNTRGPAAAAPGDELAAVIGGPGEEVTINIRNFRFLPAEMRIKQGTRVVFINEDDVEHNIIQSSPHRIGAQPTSFESPVLASGQRWSKVFMEPGEYPIVCTVDGHQWMGMVGTIIVEAL